jgi:hypothetical protein
MYLTEVLKLFLGTRVVNFIVDIKIQVRLIHTVRARRVIFKFAARVTEVPRFVTCLNIQAP